jgi:hypothetical protein
MNRRPRWLVPAVGLGLGVVIAAAEYMRYESLAGAALAFAVMLAYVLAILVLQARSETASLLAGLPADERWESINQRALAATAKVLAAVVLAAFVVAQVTGGDAMAYGWLAAVVGLVYLGGIVWFRWRS